MALVDYMMKMHLSRGNGVFILILFTLHFSVVKIEMHGKIVAALR